MLSRSEIMGGSLRSGEPRKRYPLFRVNGEPSRTRTCDPLVKSQLLYQLSYRPIYMQRAREGVLFCEERKAFYRRLARLSKEGHKKHKSKNTQEAQRRVNGKQ